MKEGKKLMNDETKNILDSYQDRKILKWMGFYLADHTEKLDNDLLNRQFIEQSKEKMSQESIDNTLQYAYEKGLGISIQKDIKDINGYYMKDTVGKIEGFNDRNLVINGETILFDEIRHIEVIPFEKWNNIGGN